jgi:pimeloyl-ACP methyl ester carboxylesterase
MTASLRLPDGRALAYADHGDPAGTPVVLVGGLGDSRLTRHPNDELTASLGVRLIGVDRPGTGGSDPHRGARLADWADDLRALADALSLERFGLVGWSMGGPFAAAGAAGLGDRVGGLALVASFAPFEDGNAGLDARTAQGFGMAARSPLFVLPFMAPMARRARRHPARFVAGLFADASESDRAAVERPGVRAMMEIAAAEAFRQGARPVSREMALIARPWGLALDAISAPVRLWYGADDHLTGPAVGARLAARIPGAELETVPDAGHMVLIDRWEEILGWVSRGR